MKSLMKVLVKCEITTGGVHFKGICFTKKIELEKVSPANMKNRAEQL